MDRIKEHFSLAKISVVHQNPAIFISSQWQHDKSQPNIKYLLYRTCHAVFLFVTWVMTLNGPWYIFLTNWGYTLLTAQSVICWVILIVATVTYRMSEKSCWKGCSKFHSVYWIIHAASNASSLLITFIFWTTIYGPSGGIFTASTFFVHGSNSIITVLDLCITAHPVHLLHCLYPLVFGLFYLAFNVAFYFYDRGRGGDGMIYNILDWNQPGKSAGVVIGIFIFLILLHVLTFVIYRLRVIAYTKISKSSTQSQEIIHNTSTLHV